MRKYVSSPLLFLTEPSSKNSEPSSDVKVRVELLQRWSGHERQLKGGVAESAHLPVGRGCGWEKLPWVSREHMDVNFCFRGYAELWVGFLLTMHYSDFEKNNWQGAGTSKAERYRGATEWVDDTVIEFQEWLSDWAGKVP